MIPFPILKEKAKETSKAFFHFLSFFVCLFSFSFFFLLMLCKCVCLTPSSIVSNFECFSVGNVYLMQLIYNKKRALQVGQLSVIQLAGILYCNICIVSSACINSVL